MTKKELQRLIDKKEQNAKEMLQIAECYLEGEVIRDKIAAEGWINKVIELGNETESIVAMALLARRVLGKEEVFSDGDYLAMKREKEFTEYLLGFATERQKKLM